MSSTRIKLLMQRGVPLLDAIKVSSVFDRLDKALDKRKDYTPLELQHELIAAWQEMSEQPTYTESDLQDAIQELRGILKKPKRVLGLEVKS